MKLIRPLSATLIALTLTAAEITAQGNAGLYRFPDVSSTHIVFSYANDLWLVPKNGGMASRMSSPPGLEAYPKFSPDGNTLAFTANYDGNRDIYLLPVQGGVSKRLTWHGHQDRMVDWHPDGKSVVFASGRSSEKERFNKFFSIPVSGGMATCLPMAYAEFGSYSPDGSRMALVFETQIGRTWKRYRGGNVADIHIFNFKDFSSENISLNSDAGDEFPMWSGNTLYFLSDRGDEKRMNLWSYDLTAKTFTQHTRFTDYDIHYPSLGNEDIVFEYAGNLCLFSLTGKTWKKVPVEVLTDGMSKKPHWVKVDDLISNMALSHDGSRVLMEARGDVFSLPAENGFVKNLTLTQDCAERYPSWAPDGKTMAWWSDKNGEYELYLTENGKETKVTNLGAGFRYQLFWSPDSRKLAFIDKAMKIWVYDRNSSALSEIDHMLRAMHYTLENFTASWSPDSRYLAYSRDLDNNHQAVFIYDHNQKGIKQVTSGYYNAYNPVFDPAGKYLYILTDRHFSPSYSSIDATFIYTNSTQVAALCLSNATPSPLFVKNDTVSLTNPESDESGKKNADKKKDKSSENSLGSNKPTPTHIDFDRLEARMVILTEQSGNYGNLAAAKGKVFYLHAPNTGTSGQNTVLKFFDLEKRKEKSVLDDCSFYILAQGGNKILVFTKNQYAVVQADESQKPDKWIRTSEMQMLVDPAKEWKQIFTDAWRLERDYFYDPAMHGVDWNAVKVQYGKMIEAATNREEVNFVLGEMIGELNASHTYRSGGDEEHEPQISVGYLGVDWKAEGNHYKIEHIVTGADWDIEARSPLSLPGVNIREGDYILAVNGRIPDTGSEPYAAFQGLADKTVELTYNSKPTFEGAKTAVVKLLGSEMRLRHLEWIEKNRKAVEKATRGNAGYIYVESTGIQGQNELIRQFNAQWDKKSLIIDERFNNGGQIPDRFIEMLNRPPLVYWSIRDGKTWPWPQYAHFGPKVMLINGWSGSGGDAFPDYFRRKKLGSLIGTRTWGGLIGISGAPSLIDGGSVTVPTFRMYHLDGTWFGEGVGVEPDIRVEENLSDMARGKDPQLERAIQEISELLKSGFSEPPVPPREKR